jgi:hypothetical protein
MGASNKELFGFNLDAAKPLAVRYALRGVLDDRGTYRPDILLRRQLEIYTEWLAFARCSNVALAAYDCSFYEWSLREGDPAFLVKPGHLVMLDGAYAVVVGRVFPGICGCWRVRPDGTVANDTAPQTCTKVEVRFADGRTSHVDALKLKPADIPAEVFALACGKAADCPMMKGV